MESYRNQMECFIHFLSLLLEIALTTAQFIADLVFLFRWDQTQPKTTSFYLLELNFWCCVLLYLGFAYRLFDLFSNFAPAEICDCPDRNFHF